MKRLFGKSLLFIVPLLAVAAVNYAGDPVHLFTGGNYERGMAKNLLSGKNITFPSDCNDRILQASYLDGLREKKDVLVLGASRSMQLGQELFPGKHFHNLSVTAATLEDLIALYERYSRNDRSPTILVLGTDPDLLSKTKSDRSAYWKWIARDYNTAAKRLGLPEKKSKFPADLDFDALDKFFQLFSPSYFQQSVMVLKRRIINHEIRTSVPTLEETGKTAIIRSDGSLRYGEEFRRRSIPQIRAQALSTANAEGRMEIDDANRGAFETFVRDLKAKKIHVIFFFAPYHPILYERLKNLGIGDVDAYYREFAKSQQIPTLGDYDPSRLGVGENGFYDGLHPTRETIRKILNSK